MPPKVTLEDDDSSDSGPDNNEPLNYEWKPRFPGAATPEANVDQILNISTGVHRGVLIMAKPLLKTGNLIKYYAADMAQLTKSMTTWIKAHKKQLAVILAGIIILALCLAMPAILGTIGFGASGPVVGSMAAAWQATIGNVVAGSLFAFLQSAAMGGAAMGLFAGFGVLGAIVAMGGAASTIDVVKEKYREAAAKSAETISESFQQVRAGAENVWQRFRGLFAKKNKDHDE